MLLDDGIDPLAERDHRRRASPEAKPSRVRGRGSFAARSGLEVHEGTGPVVGPRWKPTPTPPSETWRCRNIKVAHVQKVIEPVRSKERNRRAGSVSHRKVLAWAAYTAVQTGDSPARWSRIRSAKCWRSGLRKGSASAAALGVVRFCLPAACWKHRRSGDGAALLIRPPRERDQNASRRMVGKSYGGNVCGASRLSAWKASRPAPVPLSEPAMEILLHERPSTMPPPPPSKYVSTD